MFIIIVFTCVLGGIGIYALFRNIAIESIGELKYMKREAEKRKSILEESYKKKNAECGTQIQLAECIQMIKTEKECIHQLEEKIKNHWGWKILNPHKNYISSFDRL